MHLPHGHAARLASAQRAPRTHVTSGGVARAAAHAHMGAGHMQLTGTRHTRQVRARRHPPGPLTSPTTIRRPSSESPLRVPSVSCTTFGSGLPAREGQAQVCALGCCSGRRAPRGRGPDHTRRRCLPAGVTLDFCVGTPWACTTAHTPSSSSAAPALLADVQQKQQHAARAADASAEAAQPIAAAWRVSQAAGSQKTTAARFVNAPVACTRAEKPGMCHVRRSATVSRRVPPVRVRAAN